MQQLTTPKGRYIEKIVRDSSGRLVRATFCVYECGGRIKARLLNADFLEQDLSPKSEVAELCGYEAKKIFDTKVTFQSKVISPFYNSNLLYSSGSKPRAPTF